MAKLAPSSGFALDFLRRLLCARGAGNADHPAAAAPAHLFTPETEPRSPCIVARLMGLDAMPPSPPHALPSPSPSPPLRRSRSASSAEGSPSPWDAQQQPRVVRASASLREKPAYLRRESDEFLLLSFSPEDHRGRDVQEELEFLLAAAGRSEKAPGAAREQRRNGRCRRLLFGDEEEAVSSSSGGRRRRRMPAAECDAQQNSSPVSVLQVRDAHEEESTTTTTTSSSLEEVEHAEPCSASSDEIQNTLEQQDSRWKPQADFDQFDNPSPARSSCHASSRCSDKERRNRRAVTKGEVMTPIWQPICRLVEEDLKNMKWLVQDGANVVAEMESGILDHLISEIMDELVQGRSESVYPFPLRSKTRLGSKHIQARRAIGCY